MPEIDAFNPSPAMREFQSFVDLGIALGQSRKDAIRSAEDVMRQRAHSVSERGENG